MSDIREGMRMARDWCEMIPNGSMEQQEFDDVLHLVLHLDFGVGHHYRIPMSEVSANKVEHALEWLTRAANDERTPQGDG